MRAVSGRRGDGGKRFRVRSAVKDADGGASKLFIGSLGVLILGIFGCAISLGGGVELDSGVSVTQDRLNAAGATALDPL
jgi:hypothetical protein